MRRTVGVWAVSAALSAFAALSAAADSQTLYVSPSGDDVNDGLSDASALRSLQAAVDAAGEGDTILVADGVYEPICTDDKRITIKSTGGAGKAVIDGGHTNRCADFGWRDSTRIEGFTLCNGFLDGTDGQCSGAGAYAGTLVNCIVTNCHIACGDNCDYGYGGGIACATAVNTLVVGNTVRCVDSYGGGVSECSLVGCTVVGNAAQTTRKTGDACAPAGSAQGNGVYGGVCGMVATIVSGNFGDAPSESTVLSFFMSDSWAGDEHPGETPKFVDAKHGDYRLYAKSPCLDAVAVDEDYFGEIYLGATTDLAGQPRIQNGRIDCGAHEGGFALPTVTPENVTASQDCPGYVTLTWDESRCADAYVVTRSTTETFEAPVSVEVTRCSHVDTTVEPGVRYYYRVSARNDLGTAPDCATVGGMCIAPIEIVTEAELPPTTEMEDYSAQLSAKGGDGTYAWSQTDDAYAVARTTSSFAGSGGKALEWRKNASSSSSWLEPQVDYELPFEFKTRSGSGQTVAVNSGASLEVGGMTLGALYDSDFGIVSEDDDVFVAETADAVTFRWQLTEEFSESDTPRHAAVAITLGADGSVICAYGEGAPADAAAYCEWVNFYYDDWGDYTYDNMTQIVSVGSDGEDVAMRPLIIPPGLTLSEDGLIEGRPTDAGDYRFEVCVTGGTGGVVYKTFQISVAENANRKPVANGPVVACAALEPGNAVKVSVSAQDPDAQPLTFAWTLFAADGTILASETTGSPEFCYEITEADRGRSLYAQCQVSDGFWTIDVPLAVIGYVPRLYHVDATKGKDYSWDEGGYDGAPDGSAERPYKTLEQITDMTHSGDVVFVEPGSYGRVNAIGVIFRSVGGPDVTTVEIASGCTLEGFTLCNPSGLSAASTATLVNCVVIGSPVGATRSMLRACTVSGNAVGVMNCTVTDSIVWGNTANVDDELGASTFVNSCVDPAPSDNRSDDPKFVDAANGNFRLASDSPYKTAGRDTIGAYAVQAADEPVAIYDSASKHYGALSAWLAEHGAVAGNASAEEVAAAAMRPSPGKGGAGKVTADGQPICVWQDFVAGTDPDGDEVFRANVAFVDGQPVVTWEPALNDTDAEKGVREGVRTYHIFGKQTLDAAEGWAEVPAGGEAGYRFFKVTVGMP